MGPQPISGVLQVGGVGRKRVGAPVAETGGPSPYSDIPTLSQVR